MRNEAKREFSEAVVLLQDGSANDGPPRPPSLINKGAGKFQGSEDTIHLALYIVWGPEWEERKKFLEEQKAAAGDDQSEDGGFFDLGGWECEVKDYGAGGKRKGPRRAFVIEAVGLRFEFGRAESPMGETPNGKAMAGSLTCMLLGAAGVLKLITEFIEAMGGRLVANKLSRVDGAIDIPGIHVREFIDPYFTGCCLCRARKFSLHGENRDYQTLTLGTSPLVRIYDKTTELFATQDAAKAIFIMQHRWGGVLQADSTRVEFQLRRDDIKSMEFDGRMLNSLEDYMECRGGVWDYLCNWFRLTKEPVDKNHRDRAETSELWRDVTDSFIAWATSPISAVSRIKRPRPVDASTLNAMVVGCGLSVCSNDENFNVKTLKQSLLRAVSSALEELGEEELTRRWWVKRQRQLVALPPETDRRPFARPKGRSFEAWLDEQDAYRQAVEEAGGQMPFAWPNDPWQFIDFKTKIGN